MTRQQAPHLLLPSSCGGEISDAMSPLTAELFCHPSLGVKWAHYWLVKPALASKQLESEINLWKYICVDNSSVVWFVWWGFFPGKPNKKREKSYSLRNVHHYGPMAVCTHSHGRAGRVKERLLKRVCEWARAGTLIHFKGQSWQSALVGETVTAICHTNSKSGQFYLSSFFCD